MCLQHTYVELGCLYLPKRLVDEAINQPLPSFTWLPLVKAHLPHMPHHSPPAQIVHRTPGAEGQTKTRIPPNSSERGLNELHAAWRHIVTPHSCLSLPSSSRVLSSVA